MVVEYNTAAINGINKWIWKEIQSEFEWQEINGRRPMSIQQEPEVVNTGKPFINFAWSQDVQLAMAGLKHERAVYYVYSKDVSDVVKVMNLMADLLGRWDWSAYDLNDFIAKPANEATADQKKYDYKEIHVTSSMGPEAPDEEGGYYEGTITITYSFTVPMNDTSTQKTGFGRMSA